MRKVTIKISKSNVIDSLMPLLLSASIINDKEEIKAFQLDCLPKDYDNYTLYMEIEKEN